MTITSKREQLDKAASEILKKSGFFKKDSRPTVNSRKRRLSRKKAKNT